MRFRRQPRPICSSALVPLRAASRRAADDPKMRQATRRHATLTICVGEGAHRRGALRPPRDCRHGPRTALTLASASNTFGTHVRSAEVGRWTTLARARSPGRKRERRNQGAETAGARVARGNGATWAGGAQEEAVQHGQFDQGLEAQRRELDDHASTVLHLAGRDVGSKTPESGNSCVTREQQHLSCSIWGKINQCAPGTRTPQHDPRHPLVEACLLWPSAPAGSFSSTHGRHKQRWACGVRRTGRAAQARRKGTPQRVRCRG